MGPINSQARGLVYRCRFKFKLGNLRWHQTLSPKIPYNNPPAPLTLSSSPYLSSSSKSLQLPPKTRNLTSKIETVTIQPVPVAGANDVPSHVAPLPSQLTDVASMAGMADIALLDSSVQAPFDSIRQLFDHLRANPEAADALNASYPTRGVFKNAALKNGSSDQKLTIDISPQRLACIPTELQASLSLCGFGEVIKFFSELTTTHLDNMLSMLGAAAGGVDLFPLHRSRNINFRLCDYTPATAAPESENGCGAHRDYGTFSIIFQDGTAGLEIESPAQPGTWLPVPADKVVVLCGWCAFIVSGGELRAVRHRVRRQPGVRRLSAVLFVAPDLDVALKPITPEGSEVVRFSSEIMDGKIDVRWFKECMGKRWRYREGNAHLEDGEKITQDEDIERLILG
ncbi:Clavaminate synthase-like protein [Daldinia caldariorum]|uniref:Clavaminate synthase-like protein n=1 Tax=Daldinia caldariorum TaxID=326644 RepID=UPI002008DF6C|nr:Clavaminate synthase-like protein [Daldinia caldariorum]KAI1467810.1 Clavaminate synthase-like protein [Daldinia caldariorum]